MEAKEFEDHIKKSTTEFVAPDQKQILRSRAVEAISALKSVANALADAIIKQAADEVEKAQKELEGLRNLKA